MYKEIYRVALLQNRSGKKLLLLYVYPVIIGDNTIDGIFIYATPIMIINEQRGEIELLITQAGASKFFTPPKFLPRG